MTTIDSSAPAAPRPVLRPGCDPFPVLAAISAQLDALAAALTLLAGMFTTAAPPAPAAGAPDAAPRVKQKPPSFGDPSPAPPSDPTTTPTQE